MKVFGGDETKALYWHGGLGTLLGLLVLVTLALTIGYVTKPQLKLTTATVRNIFSLQVQW